MDNLYTIVEGKGLGPSRTALMTSRILDMESALFEELLDADNEGGGGLPSEAKIVYSYLRFMIIVIVIIRSL